MLGTTGLFQNAAEARAPLGGGKDARATVVCLLARRMAPAATLSDHRAQDPTLSSHQNHPDPTELNPQRLFLPTAHCGRVWTV